MAGCEAHNDGGNYYASYVRVALWALLFALLGAAWLILAFGPVSGWAIAIAAAAGAIVGFYVGSAIDWFARLKVQSQRTITIQGSALCAGRSPFGFQPISDGDWTCNVSVTEVTFPADLPLTAPGAGDQIAEVRLRAAPGSGIAHAFPSFNEEAKTNPILHCELSAKAGDYSVAGGAIGTVAGTALGIGIGIAICTAAGIFTFGIGAALCALIVAILAAAGALGGGLVGSLAGAFIGWVVDELSDFDKLGKTIESNSCMLAITGRWVTDISHEHNEIHDIEAVQILPCDIHVDPPRLHLLDAAVALIGRHPTGDTTPIR